MTEKPCTKCGLTKPLVDFYKGKANKDGYRTSCKTCCIDTSVKNTSSNPNTNEYMRKHKAKESSKEKARAYYIANKPKIQKQQAKYCAENKIERKIKFLSK